MGTRKVERSFTTPTVFHHRKVLSVNVILHVHVLLYINISNVKSRQRQCFNHLHNSEVIREMYCFDRSYPWWRVYASVNWFIIGSSTGLLITWTNADILSTGPLGKRVDDIWIKIRRLSLKKMHSQMTSVNYFLFCLADNQIMRRVHYDALHSDTLMHCSPQLCETIPSTI